MWFYIYTHDEQYHSIWSWQSKGCRLSNITFLQPRSSFSVRACDHLHLKSHDHWTLWKTSVATSRQKTTTSHQLSITSSLTGRVSQTWSKSQRYFGELHNLLSHRERWYHCLWQPALSPSVSLRGCSLRRGLQPYPSGPPCPRQRLGPPADTPLTNIATRQHICLYKCGQMSSYSHNTIGTSVSTSGLLMEMRSSIFMW